MAPFNCCGFRRTSSPDPLPVKLTDHSQPKQRFALSSHSTTPVETIHDTAPMHEISSSFNDDIAQHDSSATSGHNLLPLRETGSSIHHRHSSRSLQKAASQVRRRISRDSGIFKRGSKRSLRTNMSFEDTERRSELKRNLQKRVRNSLLEDSTADDDHYDEDAVRIETPKGTLGRHGGSIQVSPRHLSNILRRSESPSRSTHRGSHQLERSEAHASDNAAAITLSRMLTQRGGHLADEGEKDAAEMESVTPKRSVSKKYIFEDEETPKPADHIRSRSPLGRTSTVIKTTSATTHVDLGLRDPYFLDTAGAPHSPDFPLSRKMSDGNLVPSNQGHKPFSRRALQTTLGESRKPHLANPTLSGVYDTRIRPASADWLHGASGLLGNRGHSKDLPSERSSDLQDTHRHICDLDSEELGFGGIDGRNDSRPGSVYHTARTRSCSEGDRSTSSAHIYNMHIPSRLVSQSLLPSVSFPQLHEHKRPRSFASGGSEDFSVKSQSQASRVDTENTSGQASSSSLPSPGAPLAWENPHWRASSSIYSSQPESLISSQRSSLRRIVSLHDRLQHIKAYTPNEEIISVPASRGKSIDLEKLEQHTADVSYHSSNESLTRRELAAAETRFAPLPRANTLPKNSRFREELEQISAELALTNPVRRRFSNLDGSGEWNRASQAIVDKDAKSIWERALREHSEEDAALRHTRLGSEGIGPTDRLGSRTSISARKSAARPTLKCAPQQLSVGSWQGNDLQTRLASYKLPTPPPSPVSRQATAEPVTNNTQRSGSVYSTSSWARYPSHTRQERSSSPAGEHDQVYARDFASMTPSAQSRNSPTTPEADLVKGKDPTSIGKQVLSSIKHVYHTQSRELERRLTNEARGYRSSISEGGVDEYPELELLGSTSLPMDSSDFENKAEPEEVLGRPEQVAKKKKSRVRSAEEMQSSEDEALTWSKMYADCVVLPGSLETSQPAVEFGKPTVEGSRLKEKRRQNRDGSHDLRGSTLDFKKSLELGEEKARQEALALAGGRGVSGGEGLGQ